MPRKTAAAAARSPVCSCCFNEAAARCRGKPPRPAAEATDDVVASMRPRPDAAENLSRAERAGFKVNTLQ